MGIVSSTFASLAIRFAWNCQRLLDPKYRCIESKVTNETPDFQVTENPRKLSTAHSAISNRSHNETYLRQRERRKRRAAEFRRRKRPSTFDVALIIPNRSKNSLNAGELGVPAQVVTSIPSSLQPCWWDVSTSSGCSSDSASDTDLHSEAEHFALPRKQSIPSPTSESAEKSELKLSPGEEEAFRLTVGRGYFTGSNKDQFFNHLRLEKRLNDMNKLYTVACQKNGLPVIQRRHSGDLHRIV